MEINGYTKANLIERGISVALPSCSKTGLVVDSETGLPLPQSHDLELARLAAIAGNTILKQRYPTPTDGSAFMQRVSSDWRKYLLGEAFEVARSLADICNDMGRERFAILIFGSLGRDLVKRPCDFDPSNIDISVIGQDIQPEDRRVILNEIRSARKTSTARIKHTEAEQFCNGRCSPTLQESCKFFCTSAETESKNPLIERVGVHVQPESKITNSRFADAINLYISSSAIVAQDITGFWQQVEQQALQTIATKRSWVKEHISTVRITC